MTADPLRAGCEGVWPLAARLAPWMRTLCENTATLQAALDEHGSPMNVIDVGAMAANADELSSAAAEAGVELDIFFARKANKTLCLVDEAHRLGLGIDLASEAELVQCLDRDLPGEALMMTAAVKPRTLLRLCVDRGVTVAIDNRDELAAVSEIAQEVGVAAKVAARLAPELPERTPTRFGMPADEVVEAMAALPPSVAEVVGVHFHLDGYAVADRALAVGQALRVVDDMRARGLAPSFIDIGGGIPMSYLEQREQWDAFWNGHRRALRHGGDTATFDGHAIGPVYPAYQAPTRGEWLRRLLACELDGGATVAAALRERGLTLRCEPGRSLLDGCGLTAARVEYRKRRADGTWLIGLAMNRTQCRSAADDFLVDPLLLAAGPDAGRTGPVEAHLVGAYCIERELITWRRLRFPAGVAVGDVIVFPNTAGYLMHILESSSHQIPLARNLVHSAERELAVDPIDGP